MNKPLYSEAFRPSRAAEVVGVSRATIYRWRDAGHIVIHKVNGMSLCRTDEVLAFISGNGLGDQKG